MVTPLVGVWIEIRCEPHEPERVRVTPLVGVWIEISYFILCKMQKIVTPLVGVWIEIYITKYITKDISRHSPCGSVD